MYEMEVRNHNFTMHYYAITRNMILSHKEKNVLKNVLKRLFLSPKNEF
jgi:hypothetical protein